jgi:hypothetical protein
MIIMLYPATEFEVSKELYDPKTSLPFIKAVDNEPLINNGTLVNSETAINDAAILCSWIRSFKIPFPSTQTFFLATQHFRP